MQISRIVADMRSLLFNLTFPTMSSHCSLLKDEGCQPDDKNISSDAPTLLPDPATLPFPTNLFCSKVGVASLSRTTERGGRRCRNLLVCQLTFYPSVPNLQNIGTNLGNDRYQQDPDLIRTAKFCFFVGLQGEEGQKQEVFVKKKKSFIKSDAITLQQRFHCGIQDGDNSTSDFFRK